MTRSHSSANPSGSSAARSDPTPSATSAPNLSAENPAANPAAATSARWVAIAWAAAIGYWLALLVATHIPPEHLPDTHVSDKLEHLAGYALLTALLLFALSRATNRGATAGDISRESPIRLTIRRCATVAAVVIAFGALDEWTQPWFGRFCSLHDWLADVAGTIAVAMLAPIATRLMHVIPGIANARRRR